MKSDPQIPAGNRHLFLFSISFLSLFLELLLIRWVSTEIRIFAYFKNLVLISCFLGLGVGFSLKRFKIGLLTSIALTAVLAAAIHPAAEIHGVSLRKIPQYLVFPEFQTWYKGVEPTHLKLVAGFAMVSVIMMILAGIFVPFGQILGNIFEQSNNRIRDYSINLAGSLIGTWAFALLSFLITPPWVWFLLGAAGATLCLRPRLWKIAPALALIVPIVLLTVPKKEKGVTTYWSPYQKITLAEEVANISPKAQIPYYVVAVNSVLYMHILDLSDNMSVKYPEVYDHKEMPYYTFDLPFRFQPNPAKVLIVGAGAGNDAAAAIRNGAGEIDAVEIDPVIAGLGQRLHPERPYSNPRVNLVIDDARSFFHKTKNKYDLIIFGFLDSHILTSNFTNINLDSYVYTMESIQEAKAHLAENGVIALSFQTERKWLGYKIFSMMTTVFGRAPLVLNTRSETILHGAGGKMFIEGKPESIAKRIGEDPGLKALVASKGIPPWSYQELADKVQFDIPEDDWPYLYLQSRQIPTPHLVMTLIILAMMVSAIRFLFPSKKIGPSHFLFLGAGFMLVEVHSISKVALLFGSTWVVNVVIISAILVMILLANLLVMKYRIERITWWYAGLFASLILAYFIPVHSLIFGSYLIRGILAGTFYSLPMFFAGVVFASSIKKVAGVEAAFASNMLGSAVGGMLESASFIVGLRDVILIAMVLYLASAIALRRVPLASENKA